MFFCNVIDWPATLLKTHSSENGAPYNSYYLQFNVYSRDL